VLQGVITFAVRPAVATVEMARRGEREMRRRAGDGLERATIALVDGALADGIADRIADRLLAGPELERIVAKALEQPGVERIVNQVVASPVIQDAIARVADDAIARLRDSPAMWALIEEIARSPSVADAITAQGYGFADQVGDDIRERSRDADARLERLAWRLLRRRSPPGGAAPSTSGAT
jgi:hypothetical protein